MAIFPEVRPLIKSIVHELVMKNYEQLEADGRSDYSAYELQVTLNGRTLIDLPEEAFEEDVFPIPLHGCEPLLSHALSEDSDEFERLMETYKLDTSKESTWGVEVPLWTEEEGRSALYIDVDVYVFGENIRGRIVQIA